MTDLMAKFLNGEIVESADEWPCNVISVQHEIEGGENCGGTAQPYRPAENPEFLFNWFLGNPTTVKWYERAL